MNNLINPWINYDNLYDSLFGNVRIANINGEIVFCLNDVCRALGLDESNGSKNIRRALDERVEQTYRYNITVCSNNNKETYHSNTRVCPIPYYTISTPIQIGNGAIRYIDMIYLTEFGLNYVIFKSRKPEAVQFQNWIFSNIIPKMRRLGFNNSEELLDKALAEKERLEKENEKLKSKNKELKDNKNGLARVNKNTMVLINNMMDKRDQAAKSLINIIDILYGHTLNIKEDNLYEH